MNTTINAPGQAKGEPSRNDWLSFIGEVLVMRQLALEVCSRSSLHAVALHYRR